MCLKQGLRKYFLTKKTWFNSKVKNLLRARDAAFKSGDLQAYKEARRNLRKGIREAKCRYKQHIEEYFNSNNSRCMWQGIQTLTGYKDSHTAANTADITLPGTLNNFFARFDRQSGETRLHTALPEVNNPIVLHQHQVRSTLRRINERKAAGPDGVTGRILKGLLHPKMKILALITYHHVVPNP